MMIKLLTFLLLSLAVRGDVCDDLKALYKRQRFLTYNERETYCNHQCDFGKQISCAEFQSGVGIIFDFRDWIFTESKNLIEGKTQISEDESWLTQPRSMYILWNSTTFLLPYGSVIIPLGAQKSFSSRTASCTIVCLIYAIAITIVYWADWWVMGYTIIHALAASLLPISSAFYQDLVISYMGMAGLGVLSLAITDNISQLVLGFVVVGMHVEIIRRALDGKTESVRILVLSNSLNVIVVSRYIYFLMGILAINSLALGIVKLFVEAFLPYGEWSSLWANAVSSALYVAENLDAKLDYKIGVFIASIISYLSIFIGIRMCIGVLVLSTLKFEFDPNVLATGLYSYMIDLTNPVAILMGFYNSSKTIHGSRRLTYATLMTIMFIFEITCAREFILLRMLMYTADSLIFRTGLNDVSKFLDLDFHMGPMAFPKPGAFPFFSLEELYSISKHVHKLTVLVRDDTGNVLTTRTGVGFMRRDDRGISQIVTAHHVLDGSTEVRVGPDVMGVGEVTKVGRSVDPVVTMTSFIPGPGSDVVFLRDEETNYVAHLFMICPNKPCTLIKDFTFGRDGDIRATVNVMQGDSGSPVLAVMKNGNIRFAGVLSRGTFNTGQGNLISSVVERRLDGSPGTENAYFNVINIPDGGVIDALKEVMTEQSREYDAQMEQLDGWQDHGDGFRRGDENIPEDFGRRARERIKNWKKDRAYNKRKAAFEALISVSRFNEDQVAAARSAFANGTIVEFNVKRRYQRGMAGVGFVAGEVESGG